MLSEQDAEFWLRASEPSLAEAWDNPQDDEYAKLLEECGKAPAMSNQHRKIIINAHNVGFEDRVEFLLVWFADEDANPCQYLMLQRAREFDEQDQTLGMDDVYIERDGQGWSAYGGILRFELHNDRAYVKLEDRTATKIGGVSEIEVHFNPEPAQLRELATGLHLVFDGLNCFVNHASTLVPPNHEGSQKG